jgi:hypothetical protein
MRVLQPNWNQSKPTEKDVQRACDLVDLRPLQLESGTIATVITSLRNSHSNGGAFIAAISVGENEVLDWFLSRNRLLEYDFLSLLLRRSEIRALLPEIAIPVTITSSAVSEACNIRSSDGLSFDNPFFLDGQLAQRLFTGGAYPPEVKVTGVAAMQLAAEFCDALFGRRYEDVSLFTSYEAWTPWFAGIAWDWTSILFDKGRSTLTILVVTDTD